MNPEESTPLISKTAFSCPYCGVYTQQFWSPVFIGRYRDKQRIPTIPKEDMIDKLLLLKSDKFPEEQKNNYIEWIRKMNTGKPFIGKPENIIYQLPTLDNCNISRCYNCNEIAVWIHEQMVYPSPKIAVQPNEDLSETIKSLFNEARSIVNDSPKGAAALLRLCIQHLCKELGESGKNIDSDIGSLVSKGLNPLVQKALDVVRVIGNESVHPGEINLNDNREVAIKLFSLINLIAEQMISHPKQVETLYSKLPDNKLQVIEARNAKAKKKGGDVT